jgi:hypothetical protein
VGDEAAQPDAATVIAETERVTLALHEYPRPAPRGFDDVFAHVCAIVDPGTVELAVHSS